MRVGKRRQQGRHQTSKKVCEVCKKQYLEILYAQKKEGWIKKAVYCPDDNCPFIEKIKKVDGGANGSEESR